MSLSGFSASTLSYKACATRSVYYYFYERSKGSILKLSGGKGLSTAESMIAGFIAGTSDLSLVKYTIDANGI